MRPTTTTAVTFLALAGLFAAGQASAQGMPTTPPGINPMTGARPGNVIGTDSSLPKSNQSSNINSSDTHSVVAPRLPAPPLSDSSTPREYLMAARSALAANRTGEAQEALERAESRALAGNVLASTVNEPSQQKMVQTISMARAELAQGNKAGAIQTIDTVLGAP